MESASFKCRLKRFCPLNTEEEMRIRVVTRLIALVWPRKGTFYMGRGVSEYHGLR